jgi:hypothetical protein
MPALTGFLSPWPFALNQAGRLRASRNAATSVGAASAVTPVIARCIPRRGNSVRSVQLLERSCSQSSAGISRAAAQDSPSPRTSHRPSAPSPSLSPGGGEGGVSPGEGFWGSKRESVGAPASSPALGVRRSKAGGDAGAPVHGGLRPPRTDAQRGHELQQGKRMEANEFQERRFRFVCLHSLATQLSRLPRKCFVSGWKSTKPLSCEVVARRAGGFIPNSEVGGVRHPCLTWRAASLPPGKDGELRERIGNILCAPISVRFFPPGWKPRLYVSQGCLTPQLCFGVRVHGKGGRATCQSRLPDRSEASLHPNTSRQMITEAITPTRSAVRPAATA